MDVGPYEEYTYPRGATQNPMKAGWAGALGFLHLSSPCLDMYVHMYIHTYMHACIHTYIQTYILCVSNICIYTHIHVYIYICIHLFVPVFANGTGTPDPAPPVGLCGRSCSVIVEYMKCLKPPMSSSWRLTFQTRDSFAARGMT